MMRTISMIMRPLTDSAADEQGSCGSALPEGGRSQTTKEFLMKSITEYLQH